MMLEAFADHDTLARRVPHRARARIPLARVRRQPPHPAPARRSDDRRSARPRRRRLPAGRRAVLYAVRRRGEATAEQVAEQLGMTVSGARQHLDRARRRRARRGRRDARRASSSAAGARSRTRRPPRPTSYFPKAYGELTNELLGYVADTDPALLDDAVRQAPRAPHRQRAGAARGQAHPRREGRRAHPDPRRRRLPRDLREGRRPACTASSSTTARSGPSRSATARRARARSTSSAPRCPRRQIERVQHMVAGARHCAYEIRARAAA